VSNSLYVPSAGTEVSSGINHRASAGSGQPVVDFLCLLVINFEQYHNSNFMCPAIRTRTYSILIKSVLGVIYVFICLICLKSTTEGHEGHLYCQRYTIIHRYTPYGNVQKEEKNKK